MMFHLRILTPLHIFYEKDVVSLIAPGTIGYLEILHDHAPIITSLREGKVILTEPDHKKKHYWISGGVLEVKQNSASLLVDTISEKHTKH